MTQQEAPRVVSKAGIELPAPVAHALTRFDEVSRRILLAQAFGWAIGAKFQAQMLGSAEMQKTMKSAMGYDHMDAPSKTKVDDLIKEYIAVVGDPRLDRAALDAKLRELNKNAENTEVNFPALNWKGLIRHVPPQGSRDVLLGVDGAGWAGLRPAFDVLDVSLGT